MPESDLTEMTEPEWAELEMLYAKVSKPDPITGRYPYWTRDERDRVRELARKQYPWMQFAPSAEEMARLFGHRSQREGR